MRITKELSWMRPYVEIASTVIPDINKVVSISKSALQRGRISRQFACLTRYTSSKNTYYRITLYTKYRRVVKLNPLITQVKPLSEMELLCNLAHELAHLIDFKHTPRHRMFEAKLTLLFMSKLASEGYIDEETEFKGKKYPFESDVRTKQLLGYRKGKGR